MAIHVLNFVMFPTPHIRDASSSAHVGIPIFGADIVSLPGNKHLVALDFQPVLPINNEDGSSSKLFPEKYSHLETKLLAIHAKYQKDNDDTSETLLPWGGDIPPQALRWFSPYALWTRLGDENAMQTVSTTVWDVYREYVDLYFELMDAVQKDLDDGKLEVAPEEENNPVLSGQREYLEYRRINDPARPMLQKLYGKDWAEELIDEVLFPTL
jgi:phycoerythrobilin:ferredoxin oxidoreductase